MGIFDGIKNVGISGAIGIISMIYPPAKPVIDQIQADIADGKITPENLEASLNTALTFIEGFTPDNIDAILEQVKLVAHEAIKLEQIIVGQTAV